MSIPLKYKGIIFILLSNLILSAGSPVTAKLINIGSHHLENGRNPISFCNVLFAGNLIALFTLLLIHQSQLRTFTIKKMTISRWLLVFAGGIVSGVLTPTFYFFGIMFANVINVILISTLEIPITLFFGWIFFNESPSARMLISALLTMLGIILIVLLQSFMHQALPAGSLAAIPSGPLYSLLASYSYSGEVCILLAVIATSSSTVISYHTVRVVPAGIFTIFRMAIGVVFFFFIVVVLYGVKHFADLFSPFLWKWMLFYGSIIVAIRIYLNFVGVQYAKVAEVAIGAAIVPVASVFFAYLILGVIPGYAQIIGGSIILAGIILALSDKLEKPKVSPVLEKPPAFSGV